MSQTPLFCVYTLFSGSKGNCVYVRSGDTRILIDAGMSCRAIERGLAQVGDSLENIRAVFITHEHSDHTKALPVLLKKHPVPVHLAERTAVQLREQGIPSDCFFVHPPQFSVTVRGADMAEGGIEVQSFRTPHDSVMSVGYRLMPLDGTGRVTALATDCGCITDEIRTALTGAENVILEANHDENMLLMGSYPYELKRRILSDRGHLSNEACGAFLCDLVSHGTKHILLAHLSPENNTPELAYLTARGALQAGGYIEGEDYSLAVAKRDSPVLFVRCGDGLCEKKDA